MGPRSVKAVSDYPTPPIQRNPLPFVRSGCGVSTEVSTISRFAAIRSASSQSALMTTTVGFMEETIRQLKAAKPDCRTVVGGAVLTADYAAQIGATYYAKDAMATVRVAEEVFK